MVGDYEASSSRVGAAAKLSAAELLSAMYLVLILKSTLFAGTCRNT
jgi:hypothetical protein